MHFVVRSLQSPLGLDGSFRVHVSAENLDLMGLKVGDVCAISGGDDGTTLLGYGIAWRAADKMGTNPKQKPVKMTDTLRTAFNIKEGSHVNLSTTHAKIILAEKVMLTDTTPEDYVNGNTGDDEDEKWRTRCGYTLMNAEAFASGIVFDVNAKKGVRKRFFIDSVEARQAQSGAPNLFYCNDHTKIVLNGAELNATPDATREESMNTFASTDHRIGGLIEQLNTLNERMSDILQQARSPTDYPVYEGILIHGYEGTGKSSVLKYMKLFGFAKTIEIQKSMLDAGSISKNKAVLDSKFDEAVQHQPSLILMDDLEQLAPADGELYGNHLADRMRKLRGARVLVVAACRNPTDIYHKLFKPGCLLQLIELPIPDIQARSEILRFMLEPDTDLDGTSIANLSLRTHGFTGQDLDLLVRFAKQNARLRRNRQRNRQPQTASDEDPYKLLVDSMSSHITTAWPLKDALKPEIAENQVNGSRSNLTMEDFEYALTQVRPTALREVFFERPQIQWSDIGGSETIRKRFDEIIGRPLFQVEKMEWLRLKPTKGVLLYGPPGCSKTLTAQAVASTYDLNFISVKGAELISMYVGESERAVRDIFRKARAAAPCIIFFDEIDSIASERESGGTKGLNVLTTLLTEMDGFQSIKGVLVLAATNKPEVLDPAIMRPGRFDRHFYLGPPDEQARRQILEIQMKGTLADSVNLGVFAEVTEGYTGAEIVGMCQLAKESALTKVAEQADVLPLVQEDDLEKGLRETKRAVTKEMLAAYQTFAEK